MPENRLSRSGVQVEGQRQVAGQRVGQPVWQVGLRDAREQVAALGHRQPEPLSHVGEGKVAVGHAVHINERSPGVKPRGFLLSRRQLSQTVARLRLSDSRRLRTLVTTTTQGITSLIESPASDGPVPIGIARGL